MPSHHFAAAGIHSHIRDLPLVRREFCLIPNDHGPSLWRPKKRDELRYYLSFLWHHVVRRPLYPAYHRKRRISTDPELGPHGHPGDRHSTCHSSGSRLVNRWATQKSGALSHKAQGSLPKGQGETCNERAGLGITTASKITEPDNSDSTWA